MTKTKLGPQTLLYPMPAVLIGSMVDVKPNFMTAAWCGIACFKPPAISVAINKTRYTLQGIKEKGMFSVNIPSTDLVKKVDFCGLYSGKKKDKAKLFSIFYGELKSAPLINECPINLECKLIHLLDIGTHDLVVGEIIQTHITESCLTDGKPDPAKIDPLVYSPGVQTYQQLGNVVAPAFHVGKESR